MRDIFALLVAVAFVLGSASCSQIKLTDKKGGSTSQPSTGGGFLGMGGGNAKAAPPMTGEWELTYTINDQQVQSGVMFSQEGSALQGQGVDQTGDEWVTQNGQVNGSKISFIKKTTVRDGQPVDGTPINYVGELQYHQDADYSGWLASGEYTFSRPDGSQMGGTWLAIPKAPLGGAPEPQQAQNPGPAQTAAAGPDPGIQASGPIGDVKPRDISGRYHVSYAYNFEKINCKMWLKHDGEPLTKPNLSGDGIDTTTGDKFEITKGWYNHPNITMHRQYTKGKGAKASRLMIFKGKVSSDGKTIHMEGETQFGGRWQATLTR